MAQFNKSFFGSSLFGYTNAFSGTYTTDALDAEEPFTGLVRAELNVTLPTKTYLVSDPGMAKLPVGAWTGGTSSTVGATIDFTLSTERVTLAFAAGSTGSVKVELLNPGTETGTSQTIDTSTTKTAQLNLPYNSYILRLTVMSGTIVFTQMEAQVTSLTLQMRSGNRSGDVMNWTPYETVSLTNTAGVLEGTSTSVSNKRFVQFAFTLATSDDTVSPLVNKMTASSGDTKKRTPNGKWQVAIDLTKAAQDKGVTFRKAKRVLWKEKEPEGTNLTVRTTSRATFPTDQQLIDDANWGALTAPYRLVNNTGSSFGQPVNRIYLKTGIQKAALTGKILRPSNYGLNEATVKRAQWLRWDDQSDYPVPKNKGALAQAGLQITYEWYRNQAGPQEGETAIWRVRHPESTLGREMSIPEEYAAGNYYPRILLERAAGEGTPIVDGLTFDATMNFDSLAAQAMVSTEVSANDNGTGVTKLQTVNSTTIPWPIADGTAFNGQSLVDNPRKVKIQYTTAYPTQVKAYFKSKETSTSDRTVLDIKAGESILDDVYVVVTALEPTATTAGVAANRLYFHYLMDGGTVQYRLETKRPLGSDFSPDLLRNKKYRFSLTNGWPTQRDKVPYAMTWTELAEFLSVNEAKLIAANPNTKLYGGKVPAGKEILLPNETANPLIQLKFNAGRTWTDESSWNGSTNDVVTAYIPSMGDYGYSEWRSEEKVYTGYLNVNDVKKFYDRVQGNLKTPLAETTYLVRSGETYESIAKRRGINAIDLMRANDNKELKEGLTIRLISTLELPILLPQVLTDSENPYQIEIIEGSIEKRGGGKLTIEQLKAAASLSYTTRLSDPVTIRVNRGSVANGKDFLKHSGVKQVLSVKNVTTGTVYAPVVKGTPTTGDFMLTGNFIDWSAAHSGSREPSAGQLYDVTYQYEIVDSLRYTVDSDYYEQAGYDILWRSPEVKVIEGTCSPDYDFKTILPAASTFLDFRGNVQDVTYVIEDNDLWVKTYTQKEDDGMYLVGTMDREDPKRNWYPEMQTGFYYEEDQEYYLYSETVRLRFEEDQLSIMKNVTFEEEGVKLSPASRNLIKNSKLDKGKMAVAYSYTSTMLDVPIVDNVIVDEFKVYPTPGEAGR